MGDFENLEFEVTWSVDDGYVGKDRPQTVMVKPYDSFEEDEWNNMSDWEKQSWIEDIVEDEFANRVTYEVTNYGF